MNAQQFLAQAYFVIAMGSSPATQKTVVIDGDSLYGLCTDFDRVTDTSTCLGYVKGIANVLASGDAVGGHKACLSDAANDEQLVEIVRSYLYDAGERGGDSAAALVASALAQAFPCKR